MKTNIIERYKCFEQDSLDCKFEKPTYNYLDLFISNKILYKLPCFVVEIHFNTFLYLF